MLRHGALLVLTSILMSASGPAAAPSPILFEENFDGGSLDRWMLVSRRHIRLARADARHGQVMVLEPGGDVLALIRGSDRWGAVRIEGDVLFPTAESNYFGVAYNATARAGRRDFGLIYIKGNESYLQANPHRDFNVGRTLYPEHRVDLTGAAEVKVNQWLRFRVEVVGGTAHFYVNDLSRPQMTFPHFEGTRGMAGFQPRSVGGPVWLDNVRVSAIDAFSYDGAPVPAIAYDRSALQTTWDAIGPLQRTRDDIASSPQRPSLPWRRIETDARGAVITARVVDYHGARTVSYLRTIVKAEADGERMLHLSTVDDLALWVNGRFHWFIPRASAAWFDFPSNPAHRGQRIPVPLQRGDNHLVLRVRGGVYASGGFYARME